MNIINFDDVMDFYPKHNLSIYSKIVDAQKSGSLIPFVGAGMSVFCGYKLWGAVLRELAEFILLEDKRQAALKQIDNGAYEEAAQTILEAYPAMLDQLPNLISPKKVNDCPPERLRSSAAFVLPYLFQKGLVMTTNFDRVLENVYLNWNNKLIQTVTPKQQDRLAQLRQNQSLGLFKLHGDIGNETVSIDDLVFTGKQYMEKYADGSPLVQELTRWFENRRLLFLGCSLNVDRTMEVLKSVTLAQPGIRHYAILGCKKSDIPNRLNEMNDLGILPIFYDDNDHDAVRVILERLLEETDQESYKKLWAASRVVSVATKEERRLLFDSDYFPFTGRKQELELLEDFCASDDDISWWAVTGPGGMGKSRLVYEFTNQKRKDGWQIERFEARPSKDSNADCIEALDTWVPEIPRTIVVLDDVQAHMELVRRWLNTMVRRPRSEKLRIILLEREGTDMNSSSWLGTELSDDIPIEWCYDENFLYLDPMNNTDLLTIMDDYATAAEQKLDAELLLKTLERVDPELKRPLYAVAIADACCQGKDPTNWDRKKVLDTLLDRELDFHFNRFQGMVGKGVTKALRSELKALLARSCVRGFLLLDDVGIERYPKLVKKIEDMDMDFQEFLEGLGLLRTIQLHSVTLNQSGKSIGRSAEGERQRVIALSCPDLIKEHLVLNLAFEGGKIELLFPQEWEQDPVQLFFLSKLLVDYSDRLREQPAYWSTFFQATPQNVLPARAYGYILWGYAANYPDDARVAVDRLAQLYDEMEHDTVIAEFYAHGLVILPLKQNLPEQNKTSEELEKLYQNHLDIPEIMVAYAKGLVNLSYDQDLEGCTETVARLYKLYQNHSDILEVVVEYAKGLVNLSYNQDLEGCAETVMLIEKLYQNHSGISKIVVRYAKGLVNLSCVQDLEGCTETVARLEKLYRNHSDISEIVVEYAKGLVNLSYDQYFEDRAETVVQLNKLYQNHPDISEIVVEYAKGLINLSYNQDLEVCTETVAKLEKLYQNHSDISEIVVEYAKGLVNLSYNQDLEGCTETVAKLEKLYQNHPNREDVATRFINLLVNLSFCQKSESEVRCTLARSSDIFGQYPQNRDIQLSHAMTWFNLTLQQCEADISTTVTDIADFLRSNANVIPKFKDELEAYLCNNPDHAVQYQPLLNL